MSSSHENNTHKQIARTIESFYSAKVKNSDQSQKKNFPLESHFFVFSFQNTDEPLNH